MYPENVSGPFSVAVAHKESLRRMGVPVDEVRNVGHFSEGQKCYLEFHRENLFLEAKI